MVNSLTDMHDKIDILGEWLAAERRDIPGPAPNLLLIHYHINQLETFRNGTIFQAKKSSEQSRKTLDRWFERLSKLVADFEEYLWELAKNILPIVRAGFPDVVVKLIKICELETKEDERVRLLVSFQLSGYLLTVGCTYTGSSHQDG